MAPKKNSGELTFATNHDTERAMLDALRHKLAVKIDADQIPGHQMPAAVKQFRDLDRRIRDIDAKAVEQVVEQAYDDSDKATRANAPDWNPQAI